VNWKTTTTGILAIIAAVAGAAAGIINGTPVDWASVAAAIMAGIGLIKAADAK
jgi:UDP-N-acetylmuramate-alanine ligase